MKEVFSLKYILKLIAKDKKILIYGQILTLISILISVPIPLMLPTLVDEVLLDKPALFVNTINSTFGKGNAFYYIVIVTISVIFLRISFYITNIISIKIFTKISKYVTFKIREKILNHLKFVTMNEYESLGTGAITSNLITDVNTLDDFIISVASKFISSFFTLIAVSFVILTIDPILGIMILIIQPITMLISNRLSKKVSILKRKENEKIENFQDNLVETLELFPQIKASNKEESFFKEAIEKANSIQISSNNFNYKRVAFNNLSFTLFLITFEIFRATGLILVEYNTLSLGMMFAMFGYIWFIIGPIQEVLNIQYSYASTKAAIERLNKIFDLKTEKNAKEIINKSNNQIDVSIEKLNFSYIKNKKTLKNISLNIKAGEKVALIGASGSGKTTLAQIISGFYEKDSGIITYNNIDCNNLNKQNLRENIFLVLQMPILFNNTLRFNITMGNENITDKELYEALKTAQLYEIVENMPAKLDTIVGKNGLKLSGGQRQRLSIARMIIANPAIVIFDESTSALDVETETKLFTALIPILENKTVITIAHRLSTVKNADIIYVLNEGEIVQRGHHKELEEKEGHYLDFVKNQLI